MLLTQQALSSFAASHQVVHLVVDQSAAEAFRVVHLAELSAEQLAEHLLAALLSALTDP